MDDDLKDVRRELILQSIQRNADYSESILKWCNTTIFALNGGALVTLFGNFSDFKRMVPEVAWYFGGGMLASILASILFSYFYAMEAVSLSKKIWQGDVLNEDDFLERENKPLENVWPVLLSLLGVIASATLLILGSLEVMERLV